MAEIISKTPAQHTAQNTAQNTGQTLSQPFQPLKRVPLYMKVYQAIEADIASGRLPEGSALPTEAQLSMQLEVTRSSIREGIRLLEQAGLVERGAGKRLIVKLPKSSEVAAAASKSLAQGGVSFVEVWQALATLYPSAASLAAEILSQHTITELRQLHADLQDLAPDAHGKIVEAAVGFFQIIAAGLNNRVLLALLQSLNILIEASLRQVIENTPHAKTRILQAQQHIITALDNKDSQQASHWMSKHIHDLKRGYDVAKIDLKEPVS